MLVYCCRVCVCVFGDRLWEIESAPRWDDFLRYFVIETVIDGVFVLQEAMPVH